MEYRQFVDDVSDCIRFKVERGYDIKVNRIMKNNSIELDGIVFFKEGDMISPNIYLNSYYERYQSGESMESIAEDIIEVYETSMRTQSEEYCHFNFSFDEMKDTIVYRLVNYQKNRKLLQEVPHVRFLDLAITFHCLVKRDGQGIGTIRLTNEHTSEWKVKIKDLMKLAITNTTRLFPAKLSTMEEVIADILQKDFSEMYETAKEENEAMLQAMLSNLLQEQRDPQMYILSNDIGINGATSIIYKDVIKEFSEEKDCDFYILPSSIHEVILVPYEEELEVQELRGMVMDVNGSQVPEEEILSNRVYIYRRGTNSIEVAE